MMTDKQLIYLDNNATTEIDPAVIEEMMPFLTRFYANPSSGYRAARHVRDAIEKARAQMAAALDCKPAEIIFTSGGTESSNAALGSALDFLPAGKHLVTSTVEHSAVRRFCEEQARRGCQVTSVGVDAQGRIDPAEIEAAIRPETAIVSIMWANNETGVVSPIAEIAQICLRKRVLFHTDAVQVLGKIPIRLSETPVNFLALSAHKFHGPKGIGALFVRSGTRFSPSIIGGSHESGRRAGTEDVVSIVGMGKAAEMAAAKTTEEQTRVRALRDRFEEVLRERTSDVVINGVGADRLSNTSSVAFQGLESHAALMLLDSVGICCSAGSACRTGSQAASHVLKAMGLSDERARGTLRFSLGRYNSAADVENGAAQICAVVSKLRAMVAH